MKQMMNMLRGSKKSHSIEVLWIVNNINEIEGNVLLLDVRCVKIPIVLITPTAFAPHFQSINFVNRLKNRRLLNLGSYLKDRVLS